MACTCQSGGISKKHRTGVVRDENGVLVLLGSIAYARASQIKLRACSTYPHICTQPSLTNFVVNMTTKPGQRLSREAVLI